MLYTNHQIFSSNIQTILILVLLQLSGSIVFAQGNKLLIEDVVFISKMDGSEQHYVEIKPVGFDENKTYHLMIALHGHGSDRWQFVESDRSECAATRSIAEKYKMIMVSPDYRAKTSWMGPAAESDLNQIIEELKAKYEVDKVFLMGGSMGGTSALTYAALHPNQIDGVTSLNGHANHLEYENFQDAISSSFGGHKAEIPEEYKKRSAEYWPERLTMPIAFTVGEFDESVPGTSILRLVEILERLKREVLLIVHPKGGHSTNLIESKVALEFMIESAIKK
ncbi:carboxylesterase family protein [Membranihabitans marinus]|uniref:carboxylesterase family protein n=1 Tax=Membranihabitans marinus TaxID=1227546 RepID=UPI001F1EBD4A|nr:alpha/beta fold hydrolase [Membranihabitans marinus]